MIKEFFTVQNMTAIFALLTALYAVLKTAAPRTRTSLDDKIVASADRFKYWIREYAPLAWAIAEQLCNSGKIAKLDKYAEYLKILKEAFHKSFGTAMTAETESEAALQAQGLSAVDKLQKAAAANPSTPAGGKEASKSQPAAPKA